MNPNSKLAFVVFMFVAAIGALIQIGRKTGRKFSRWFGGKDSGAEDSSEEIARGIVAAVTQAELTAGRDTFRTRRYYSDRAEAELDNELHDKADRRQKIDLLWRLKTRLSVGRKVKYVSAKGLRSAKVLGYRTKKGKTFVARLQLASGVIVRKHVIKLVVA